MYLIEGMVLLKKRWMLIFFLVLLSFTSIVTAAPDDVTVDIVETGSVLDYYGIYYIVDVTGTVTITNEKDFHIYGITIPMSPGTLSLVESSASTYLTPDGVKVPFLDPGESVTFSYKMFGITTVDVIKNYPTSGWSVFSSLMNDRNVYFRSDMWIELGKGPTSVMSKLLQRDLDISITNPWDIEYNVNGIQVYRTDDEDINNPNKIWTFDDKVIILGGETWHKLFTDSGEGMKEDSVYWLVVDHEPANEFANMLENANLDLYTEADMLEVPSLDNGTILPGEEGEKPLFARTKVFVRKTIDPSRIFPGDLVNVTIIVTNLDVESKKVRVEDSLPPGFEVAEITTTDGLIDENNLVWSINVNKDTSKIVTYTLRFVDDASIGLDYLPEANVFYDGGRASSPRVPFIKQFIPQKKLYVQKNIRNVDPSTIEITISLRNLGEATLNDLVVKDYLEAENDFSEITQTPDSKGVWQVPPLEKDQLWVVSYKTNNNPNIQKLPLIFGIDESNVLKTLILDNVFSNSFISPTAGYILEIVGLVVLILFPFLIILLYKKKFLDKGF